MELITECDVSRRKVNQALQVFAKCFQLEIPFIPRIALYRAELAMALMADAHAFSRIAQDDSKVDELKPTTLMHDGTTKRQSELYAVAVNNEKGYTLTSLRNMSDKTAQTAITTFISTMRRRWHSQLISGDETEREINFCKMLLSIRSNVIKQHVIRHSMFITKHHVLTHTLHLLSTFLHRSVTSVLQRGNLLKISVLLKPISLRNTGQNFHLRAQ